MWRHRQKCDSREDGAGRRLLGGVRLGIPTACKARLETCSGLSINWPLPYSPSVAPQSKCVLSKSDFEGWCPQESIATAFIGRKIEGL